MDALCQFDAGGTCVVCGHVTPYPQPVYRRCGPAFVPVPGEPFDLSSIPPPRRSWWLRRGGTVRDWVEPPRGLGDWVAAALGWVGITEERVSRWIGRPCGCGARRRWLNDAGRKVAGMFRYG